MRAFTLFRFDDASFTNIQPSLCSTAEPSRGVGASSPMKQLAERLCILPPASIAGFSASPSSFLGRSNANPRHLGPAINTSLSFGEQLLAQLPRTMYQSVAMRSGQHILRIGDSLRYLYVVRAGYLKSEYALASGYCQVTQFIQPTDCFGADAIASGSHYLDRVALCDGSFIRIDYAQLQHHLQTNPSAQSLLDKIMSQGWIQAQDRVFSLGAHTSEQKLAYFLLDFHEKQGHRAPASLRLPMGREDLGSYLGITIESLSRAFAFLERNQLLQVSNRMVSELNIEGLALLLLV